MKMLHYLLVFLSNQLCLRELIIEGRPYPVTTIKGQGIPLRNATRFMAIHPSHKVEAEVDMANCPPERLTIVGPNIAPRTLTLL